MATRTFKTNDTIRGDEDARVVGVDEVDHDAVVLQRAHILGTGWLVTMMRDKHLATRLGQYGTRWPKEEAEVGVARVRPLQGSGVNKVEVDGASPVGETGRGRGRGGRGVGRGGRGPGSPVAPVE